jgi:hypothetical protein
MDRSQPGKMTNGMSAEDADQAAAGSIKDPSQKGPWTQPGPRRPPAQPLACCAFAAAAFAGALVFSLASTAVPAKKSGFGSV